MSVICHQDIGVYGTPIPISRFVQQGEITTKIRIFKKNGLPIITPLNDMGSITR